MAAEAVRPFEGEIVKPIRGGSFTGKFGLTSEGLTSIMRCFLRKLNREIDRRLD